MNKIDTITLNLKIATENHQSFKIEVAPNMSLRALHYTIQEKFGLDDKGYHYFALPRNRFEELTENDLSKWRRLVGVFFKSEHYSSNRCLDNADTYYEAQRMIDYAGEAKNILFEALTVGDVFFVPNTKKIINRDKILEHLLFVENDSKGAEKALREALSKNDKETATFILKASKIYNCPITDTLHYYFNDFHVEIMRL